MEGNFDYIIYTDGSCRVDSNIKKIENCGKGGCGIVILDENKNVLKKISKGYNLTTSTRMELMAILTGLQNIGEKNSSILLYTDSFMAINGFNKRNIPTVNLDLWNKIYELSKDFDIQIKHVKGHNGDKYNEICDELAFKASKQKSLLNDNDFIHSIKRKKRS